VVNGLADVSWFKSLNSKYRTLRSEWYNAGEKIITKYGNIGCPGFQNMIQWINNCWFDLDETIISDSFICCGITCNNMDKYNFHLQEMLKTNIVPPNGTVESKTTEDDDFFLRCICVRF
jgi:hypothetical protein